MIEGSAIISDCGKYRYQLERALVPDDLCSSVTDRPIVAGIMINPSTADANRDDQTIRKWIGFGRRLGASKIIIGNLFAYRATDPRDLLTCADPIGDGNDAFLGKIMREADIHIVAWGASAKFPPAHRDRWRVIPELSNQIGATIRCFGVANDGHPRHPLMIPYDTPLVRWYPPQ